MNKIGLPSILLVVCVGLLVVLNPAVSQPILQVKPTPAQMSSLFAFMSDRSNNTEIYIMRPDGSNLIRLTENSRYDTSPMWLSDTGMILFSAVRDEHERQVLPYTIAIDSLQEQLFPPIATLLEQEFYDVSQFSLRRMEAGSPLFL